MDAEARIMPFFHRVHEVDEFMVSLEFQDCDYCHEGWFGSSRKREDLPGGFESEAYKKTIFLRAPESQCPGWILTGLFVKTVCWKRRRRATQRSLSGRLPRTLQTLVLPYQKQML